MLHNLPENTFIIKVDIDAACQLLVHTDNRHSCLLRLLYHTQVVLILLERLCHQYNRIVPLHGHGIKNLLFSHIRQVMIVKIGQSGIKHNLAVMLSAFPCNRTYHIHALVIVNRSNDKCNNLIIFSL